MKCYPLYGEHIPGVPYEIPSIIHYEPTVRRSDAAVVIFPGGGYSHRAPHEGNGYAEFLSRLGINAFVAHYRTTPCFFPDPLMDARRAVRFVRANAERFGIAPDRIAVMGSSAGGHLAALVSNYRKPLAGEGVDEIDALPYLPNLTILCYAVLSADEAISHQGSFRYLLGDAYPDRFEVDPTLLVEDDTPPAFIWHTATDTGVNVINSYRYATALREHNIPCEMHIFPIGPHGMGLAAYNPHVAQWSGLLANYLRLIGFLPSEN